MLYIFNRSNGVHIAWNAEEKPRHTKAAKGPLKVILTRSAG